MINRCTVCGRLSESGMNIGEGFICSECERRIANSVPGTADYDELLAALRALNIPDLSNADGETIKSYIVNSVSELLADAGLERKGSVSKSHPEAASGDDATTDDDGIDFSDPELRKARGEAELLARIAEVEDEPESEDDGETDEEFLKDIGLNGASALSALDGLDGADCPRSDEPDGASDEAGQSDAPDGDKQD